MWKNVPLWRKNPQILTALATLTFTFCVMCHWRWNFTLKSKLYGLLVLEPRIKNGLCRCQTHLCFSYRELSLIWRTPLNIPCVGFHMGIWQVAPRVTQGCSRDCPCFVPILCPVSAQAADTAHLCPWARNPSAPGRRSALLCLSVAFERDWGLSGQLR